MSGSTGSVRLAVTGASGFCGAAVARLAAAAGCDVICFGRRPGPVGRHVRWDASRDVPDLTGVDAVVHLAAAVGDPGPGRAAEAAYRAVNVDGTARLLDAAAGLPVVWVSSASVYRPGPYAGPVREDHPIDGQRSAYGRTKAAGEALALAAGAVVLRPRAVYGEGDPHLLPRLRRVVRGGRAWLPGPDVPLSLTAVTNLAGACLSALGFPSPGPVPDARLTGLDVHLTASAGRENDGRSLPGASATKTDGWAAGAYNVADAEPYLRDAVVGAALGASVRHIPVGVARTLAATASLAALGGRAPLLTRYAIDQLTDGLVLDIGKAAGQGWRPHPTAGPYRKAANPPV
jgi:nucleoside-diphosphate-sugar epimerase